MTHPKKITQVGMWLCVGFILSTIYALAVDGPENQLYQLVTALAVAGVGLCLCALDWFKFRNIGVFYGHNRLLHLRSFRWPQYHFYAGPASWYRDYFLPGTGHREYIALVTCKLPNGNIYAVERPGRHHHVLHLMHDHGLVEKGKIDQGFMTSHGRYVSRSEAVIIAGSAGQIHYKTQPVNQLFSEDLWSTPPSHRYMSSHVISEEWQREGIMRGQPSHEECKPREAQSTELPQVAHEQPQQQSSR